MNLFPCPETFRNLNKRGVEKKKIVLQKKEA